MRRDRADFHYRYDEAGNEIPQPEGPTQDSDTMATPVVLDADSAVGDTERLSGSSKSVVLGDLGHNASGGIHVKGALTAVKKSGQPLSREATEIRRGLRGSFDARVRVLEAMADGECVEKRQVKLTEIVPFVACPNCGEQGLVVNEGSAMREIDTLASVRPKERLAAMDILAKYGLGQLKETSVEEVRERVGQTVALARQMLAPDLAEQFILGMKPIWKA